MTVLTYLCTYVPIHFFNFTGIQQKVAKKGPFFQRLIDFSYRYKSAYRKRGMNTPILDALIFKNMRAIVGGRIRLLLSGGAPLSPDTHDFVRCALSLPLVQVRIEKNKNVLLGL